MPMASIDVPSAGLATLRAKERSVAATTGGATTVTPPPATSAKSEEAAGVVASADVSVALMLPAAAADGAATVAWMRVAVPSALGCGTSAMSLAATPASDESAAAMASSLGGVKSEVAPATSRLATVQLERHEQSERVRTVLTQFENALERRRPFPRLADERQVVERAKAQLAQLLEREYAAGDLGL